MRECHFFGPPPDDELSFWFPLKPIQEGYPQNRHAHVISRNRAWRQFVERQRYWHLEFQEVAMMGLVAWNPRGIPVALLPVISHVLPWIQDSPPSFWGPRPWG